jgi:hypothetical protein
MRWRRRLIPLRRGDVLAIVLALGLIGGWAVLALSGRWGQSWLGAVLPRFGFGSDWHCTWIGKGDPVCIKEPGKPANPSPH